MVFVAIRDFNKEEEEPPIGQQDLVLVLSFEAGDLIVVTMPPN